MYVTGYPEILKDLLISTQCWCFALVWEQCLGYLNGSLKKVKPKWFSGCSFMLHMYVLSSSISNFYF